MPDLIQVADELKSMPDQYLAQQMQNPSGTAPPWLIATEIERRQKLRSGASRAEAPTSSVSQDLLKSLFAKIPPTAGLGPQEAPGGAVPPGMAPVSLNPGAGAMGPPPGNMGAPKTMAYGGSFDDEDLQNTDDEGDDEENNRPNFHNPNLYNPAASRRNELKMLAPPQQPQQSQALAPPQTSGLARPAGSQYPGFEPIQQPDPGAAGHNVYGQNYTVKPPPAVSAEVPGLFADRERAYKDATKEAPDYRDAQHVDQVKKWLGSIYGEEPDTKALKDEMDYLRQKAHESRPTLSRLMMNWENNMLAAKGPSVWQAMGQAGQQTSEQQQHMVDRQTQMELAWRQTAAQMAQRQQEYKQKIASEVIRAQDAQERRFQTDQQRAATRYQHAAGQIDSAQRARERQVYQYQADISKSYNDSLNRHMTHADAVAGMNSEDPDVRKLSQDFLTQETALTKSAEDRRREGAAEEAKKRDAERDKDTKERETRAQAEWDRRNKITHDQKLADAKTATGTVKTKWDDADTKNDARAFIQEQLDHIKADGSSSWLNEAGPDGKVSPVFLTKDGEPVKRKSDLLAVAKARARANLMDESNWNEMPRFKNNWAERQRVANAINSITLRPEQIVVGAKYGGPHGFHPPQDGQQQPAGQPPQQQAAPAGGPPPQQAPPQPAGGPAQVSVYPPAVGAHGFGVYTTKATNSRGENKRYEARPDGTIWLMNP